MLKFLFAASVLICYAQCFLPRPNTKLKNELRYSSLVGCGSEDIPVDTSIICSDNLNKLSNRDVKNGRELVERKNRYSFCGLSTQEVVLKWETPPKRIFFLVKRDLDIKIVLEAVEMMLQRELIIYLETSILRETILSSLYLHSAGLRNRTTLDESILIIDEKHLDEGVDFIITFGGDGLLLHCNTLFGPRMIPPTMCFDFGSLGFLAPFKYNDFEKEIDLVLSGLTKLTLRMRLECSVYRNQILIDTYNVLNEAVIDRGPSPFLSAIDLDCDDSYLTTVQGDGLIIATPTGSTAYSLAAGGSMVHPSVPAILITPICAHSLSFRPVLLPDSAVLTCTVPEDARSSGWVSFDGKYRQELQCGDKIVIRMSSHLFPTINRVSYTADWFDALRSQFMFNLRPRQKKL